MTLPVAILAGGLGTRLQPFTLTTPKALVPVGEEAFIDHQIRLLAGQGFTRIVICTGYLGDQIMAHVGTGKQYGWDDLEIAYSCDGPEPLGTAGAIRKALPLLGPSFGVLYGDVYPLYDLVAIQQHFIHSGGTVVMAVRSPGRGNVKYALGQVTAYNPIGGFDYGDAGFSVMSASAIAHSIDPSLRADIADLGLLFVWLAAGHCMDGYEVTEPVYEVGSFEGLAEFKDYLSRRVLHG
jgi:N-acetyl-alpha-D-muramate 1-phosphate uridylyltransferase